jgi:YD repeat-containing protein
VTVTDQAGKQRRSVSDGLGRLVRVDEPDANGNLGASSSPTQPTYYSYDALGNLRQVNQGGQIRYFMYDSLSRLIRAKNPEQAAGSIASNITDPVTGNNQWSMAYGYDNNGNLTARVDARNITTTYTYDNLNRVTDVGYSDGTPGVGNAYDTATNGRGRFASNWTWLNEQSPNSVKSINEYDAAGRAKQQNQYFWTNGAWSTPYQTSRTYDLAGNVTSETYPSGHTVNYSYDAAGRLGDNGSALAFTGTLGDGAQRTYATGVSYDEASRLREALPQAALQRAGATLRRAALDAVASGERVGLEPGRPRQLLRRGGVGAEQHDQQRQPDDATVLGARRRRD